MAMAEQIPGQLPMQGQIPEQQFSPEDQQIIQQLTQIAESPNLVDMVGDTDLSEMGTTVIRMYDLDLESMKEWTDRMDKALDFAMLVKKEKTYPFASGSSNIIYPLITSAALQYNARAYPAIVPASEVVKVATYGEDEDGSKQARAERVSEFQTWQLKVESREWEKCTDQLLLQLPIVGDMFRKTWFDPDADRIRSQIRMPGRHVVVNNNATSLQDVPRISDKIELYPYQVDARIASGHFAEFTYKQDDEDSQGPVEFIEQHTRLDLDGDGYAEPYIVTAYRETQKVVRIVAGFDVGDVSLSPDSASVASIEQSGFFTHYQFMPAMDGGFFGSGMGLLLGDISSSINTTINMIMDSAHLQSLGGGFIGAKNFQVKGGAQRRQPGEWKQVSAYGDDVRKAMVSIDHPGPSPILFQMLGMLIDSGREIASVQDIMTGDSGRSNMPVGTTLALIEQGMQVFTASYKRIYRSLSSEYELIAKLNARYLDPQKYAAFFDGPEPADPASDFNLGDMDILPVADPQSVTSMQKMGKAQFLMELSANGQVDMAEATRRMLEAANIDGIDQLLPQPSEEEMAQQQMMQQVQEEMIILDVRIKDAEAAMAEAKVEETIAATQQKMASAVKDLSDVEESETSAPMRRRIDELKAMKEVIGAQRQRLGGVAGQRGNAEAPSGSPQRV